MSDKNLEYQPTDKDVQILREWLKKMPYIVQDYDDTFLAVFIKGKKGSLQKAKISLEKFNNFGFLYPDFFGHINISDQTTQKCLKEAMLFPLAKRLNNGAHVFVCSMDFKGTESKKSHFMEIWRYWFILFFVLAWESDPYIKNVTIFDWKNLRIGHVKELTPVLIMRMMEPLKCLPIRILAVYNVNVPPALERILNMVKAVLSEKLAEKFHFISSMDTLHQSIPREILPKEYGGDQDEIKTMHRHWMEKVERYRDRLVEENVKMRKLDPLRPKEEDMQKDMVGTFKSINFD